jgi:C-terminal processing protease CtpA/Prc
VDDGAGGLLNTLTQNIGRWLRNLTSPRTKHYSIVFAGCHGLFSRKKKGYENRKKAKAKLAKLHARIGDIRKDALHCLATNLTRRSLLLLQDSVTASAAEAFIAGLTGNGRARSIGERSYGKGLAQRFLPLPDGSALLLTYAEILTPGEVSWHERGLVPDIQLSREHLDLDFSRSATVSALLDFIKIHQK